MNKLSLKTLKFPSFPVKELIIVKIISKVSSKINYSILDLKGKVVISGIAETYNDLIKISIKTLKSGFYLLQLSDEESFVVNGFEVG